jgi:hypothetical protein
MSGPVGGAYGLVVVRDELVVESDSATAGVGGSAGARFDGMNGSLVMLGKLVGGAAASRVF